MSVKQVQCLRNRYICETDIVPLSQTGIPVPVKQTLYLFHRYIVSVETDLVPVSGTMSVKQEVQCL